MRVNSEENDATRDRLKTERRQCRQDLTREDGARQSSIDLFTGGASAGSSQGDGHAHGSSGL